MQFNGVFLLGLLLLPASDATSPFVADVVRPAQKSQQKQRMNDALLSRAVPLAEYQASLAQAGLHMENDNSRALEQENEKNDDFYQFDDDQEVYSFSGYSIKYAQCQPVQYFSENAIKAGEHSPMLTKDVVVLRLCPYQSCSESTQYGCHYNYAEYALTLPDYLTIMLKFGAIKRDNICAWCEDCMADDNRGRKLDENNDNQDQDNNDNNDNQDDDQDNDEDNDNQDEEDQDQEEENNDNQDNNDNEEDQAAQYDDAYYQYDNDGNNNANNNYNDGGSSSNYYQSSYSSNKEGCEDFDTYCSDYDSYCAEANDDNGYMEYADYIDYLDCAQVEYNEYAYFVRPRCVDGSIKMAVYYDAYCAQKTESVSVKDLGMGFQEGVFSEFYTSECIGCSETVRAY
jgi:hypothetical protein